MSLSLQAQQQRVAERKAEIDELVKDAQTLLEGRPDGDKTELEQLQYQQLQVTSADLKATHEKVCYLYSPDDSDWN